MDAATLCCTGRQFGGHAGGSSAAASTPLALARSAGGAVARNVDIGGHRWVFRRGIRAADAGKVVRLAVRTGASSQRAENRWQTSPGAGAVWSQPSAE